MTSSLYEVLVIGGGPAGLTAALYLARYDRRVALFDTGHGRSTWHQVNHNYLGFPGGIPARQLRELGCLQLQDYPQVTTIPHKIDHITRLPDGLFKATGRAGEWCGQAVILCTGVIDHFPHFPGWEEYVGRSLFWCITCDGYQAKGARVVVAGNNNASACLALQLQRFTRHIVLLTHSYEDHISPVFHQRLRNAHIPVICDKIDQVKGHCGQIEAICTKQGRRIDCDLLFSHHGSTPQTKLAKDLDVTLNDMGYIVVDIEQKTSVPGVYAAGDVTGIHAHQISTAVHEGGQAASAANYFLYPIELKDEE